MAQKIDFVIIWVDGSDPEWQSEKQKYTPGENTDNRAIRYLDWDNLEYWFRGVEKYTPWVNKVHFVTWGHLPKWLNTSHPKLNIVKHEDYIPKEYLPTFSSHTIELNIHRIKGLSEKFVFFNDDTFILRNMKPNDFFNGDLARDRMAITAITPSDDPISSTIFNNIKIINRHFNKKISMRKNISNLLFPRCGIHGIKTLLTLPYGRFTGFYDDHIPYAYTKTLFNEVWEKEAEILHKTSLDKFRSGDGVNQWLMRYWRLAKGEFIKCSSRQGKLLTITDDNDIIHKAIVNQRYNMVCCNDNGEYTDFDRVSKMLRQSFNLILPDKSSFETYNV